VDGHQEKVGFIWSVVDLLRGAYKQSEYGRVILPFTVLRRLDCVLEPTKDAVLDKAKSLPKDVDAAMRDTILNMVAGQTFHNLSRFTFERLNSDSDHIENNKNKETTRAGK
jgi:type I restriction enzyme M protein